MLHLEPVAAMRPAQSSLLTPRSMQCRMFLAPRLITAPRRQFLQPERKSQSQGLRPTKPKVTVSQKQQKVAPHHMSYGQNSLYIPVSCSIRILLYEPLIRSFDHGSYTAKEDSRRGLQTASGLRRSPKHPCKTRTLRLFPSNIKEEHYLRACCCNPLHYVDPTCSCHAWVAVKEVELKHHYKDTRISTYHGPS